MNRHLYHQIRTVHVLSVIAVFAISAGILLAAQSGCIGATLAGTDGSYDTPDTGLSEHAPVQAVTAWEGMSNLSAACQIADTFADMLFTGVLDAAYAVHAVLSLTAVDNITDNSTLVLDRASDITTFVSGGHTYAAVTAYTDYGVQILNVTNPSNITAAGSITDTDTLELRGARGITTFVSGGHTYAAVAAYFSDGVQILDVTDLPNITPAGNITDTDILKLDGAFGITTFVSGDHTYAAVAAREDDGVQILNVTDPLRITAAGHITDDGTSTDSLELWDARGITIFVSDGHKYAAVAAYEDDGVQILDVTDLPNITPAGNITDTDILKLDGAFGITTFVSGDHTYVAVAAYEDDGVQILNVTDPLRITPAGSITDPLKLNGAQGITTFTSGDHTYVAVAANRDNGVQILDVTDLPNITLAGNIRDANNNIDDLELHRVQGITTFTSGDHTYAAVAANDDDAVQIIRINIPPDTTLPADAFVTTWRTTSADESITLPLVGTDITINWGDGNTTAGVSTPVDHTYNTAGDYTVQITGGLTWFHLNNAADASKLVSLDQWGTASWASMENAFSDASNMVYNAGDAPDLSGVTDMSNMFDSAAAFDGDLSSWDVSSVTDMNSMFSGASSFNQPLNDWGVSSVTDMSGMFRSASDFNQPLNDWNVSSVTDMHNMFDVARSFNQPLNDWGVSSVTDMSGMFRSASDFNQPLNDWNVSSVTDMHNMFDVARSFNQPLNDWDVSSVASMSNMFHIASDFNQPLNSWNVSSVIDMNGMFHFASSFNQPLNSWNVSSVTDMNGMFHFASSFNQPLNDWDVSSVTDMSNMFRNASSFTQNLGNWYVTLDPDTIADTGIPGVVGTISAQNQPLKNHSPTYVIVDGLDKNHFEIVPGNQLNMISGVSGKAEYSVNVTASGSNVFENGNNWRVLEITVRDSTNSPPVVQAGDDQTVGEGDTVTLSGSVTPDGDPITYAWSQTNPDAPPITFANASASSTTFVAPAVTGDTTFIITLTANDGTQSAADALNVTVRETGAAFITTWTASDSDKSITLLMKGMYSILWGDGSNSTNVSDSQSHTYSTAGTYTVTVLGDGLKSISLFSDNANALQLESIEQWGGTEWTTMDDAFEGASNMVYRATDAPDLSKVTHTSGMFWGASSFDGDLSGWNVSSVTNMLGMFIGASSFNQPLNSWNVSSVRDMSYMFFGASSFDQPLNAWNVSKVTSMASMFIRATSFNQPLNDWDVSSVTSMAEMFDSATSFNQDLSSWYITPDSAALITDRSRTLTVMPLSPYIGEQSLGYTVSDARFVMNGRTLSLSSTDTPTADIYDLDITATAVLDEPNADTHTRTVTITVSDPPAIPFITTWKTTSADESITLPLVGTDITINWGDGSTTAGVSTPVDHPYNTAGDYTVQITGGLERIYLNGQQPNAGRLISIDQWGDIRWTSMRDAFDGASNMVYNATDAPDLSGVTDMSYMFFGASSFNGDLSSWDVSKVTNMNRMFFGASSFNQTISSWDVSAVTDMSSMFDSATAFDGDLSSWDVSAVTNMNRMFFGASSFNQTISSWDVSAVTDMHRMFYEASDFNQPLNDWDVSSVSEMGSMFYQAADFNQPLNAWDVSSVTDMSDMFDFATSFNQPLNSWDVSSVTDMTGMFSSASSFNQTLNSWDVSSVTDMSYMFFGASSFDQPLNNWNVSSVTDMTGMFEGASSFNQPLNNWNVSSVIGVGMIFMFHNADDFDQNLGNWYVVANATSIARADVPRVVAEISAQNDHLNGHNLTYGIGGDNDYAFFEIVNDNKINMTSVGTKSSYRVNVTASGSNVFESGNNWRLLEITVRDSTNTDSAPPAFVSSILDMATGNLTITFSEEIDAANVVPASIHMRESGTYTGGVTLTATELVTIADGTVISFALNATHLGVVAAMTEPELTIDPGAVQDTSGRLIVSTFEASTATFVDAFSVSLQDATPADITFSNDGAKMFMIGRSGDAVYEYALSTPFDVSTATFVDSFSVLLQESGSTGIAFSSDGAKMFVVGSGGDAVHEYELFTPFDASTAAFVYTFSVSLQDIVPTGMAFSSDGAKMFVVGSRGDAVHEYALSTPFDASTAAFVYTFSVSSRSSNPQGMAFSSDGTKMFVIDNGRDTVIEYEMSTPFDASTAAFVDATSIRSQVDSPTGIAFSSDGAKMFVTGSISDSVHEYDLSSAYPIEVTGTYVSPPPTFVSSILGMATGSLAITFSDEIDAANVVPAKIHVRESGNYTHGVTLTVTELDTAADGIVISFTLNATHFEAVAAMTAPELTIDPGAVRDTYGSLIVGTFEASTASFVDATSISDEEDAPHGIAFSSDGTKMFVIGIVGDDVNEYELSTPFDVSTRTWVDATSISAQEITATGIAFSSDGAKMFVIGLGGNVNEYELSTPFDASTLTFVDATSISSQETFPTGIAFSSNGTKMFVVGTQGDDVNEYALSTPFDVSTRTWVDATFISSQETFPSDIAFSSDGTKMFVIDNGRDTVIEYELSTPFDASTLTFVDATLISAQETSPRGIAFSSDGTKMFVIGNTGKDVNEYDLSSVYPIAVAGTYVPPPPTFVSSGLDFTTGNLTITFSEEIDAANVVPAKIHVRESGNYTHGVTLTVTELDTAADGIVISFTLNATHFEAVAAMTAPELTIDPGAVRDTSGSLIVGTFEASTASFVTATSISLQENKPTGITFSSDGAKMFVIGLGGNVNEYELSTPFDASTRTFVDATSISSQETFPTGIAFSSDGTKMFVIGDTGDDVNEYELSTSFDASTRTWVDATQISEQETGPTGIAFSSDGAKMFVIGRTGDDVNEYALSTPFDASTASFVDATQISEQETNPRGIAFSSDGTKMFVVGNTGEDVNEYNLSTPFDVSTRTWVDATSISEQETFPTGIAFSSDGTKMFVIGDTGDDVNEYALSSVYPITVTDPTAMPFITTWRTDSANQTITIPVGGSTARYSIDWGDNSPAGTDITGDSTHTYREADSYTVSISGGFEKFHLDDQQPNAGRLISIDQWGDIRWTSMSGAFDGAYNMVYLATDAPDLSLVSDMSYMFAYASSFNGNLSSWDVSKVTNMESMFRGASFFNQPLNDWNVSAVTNMIRMFHTASSFNQTISSWDVSAVTDMHHMFYEASDFNQPLNSWDVSSVTDMNSMFSGASSFNQTLNDWDVSSVTNMKGMFNDATSFDGDLSSWNVTKVSNMVEMFANTPSFQQNLGNWYVVANATSIAKADVPGVVAEISAQNDYLNGHNPMYGIGRDSDYAFFEIVNDNKINMTSVGTKSSYMVNVTASGSNVFENGNNWRLLEIKVTGQTTDATPPVIKLEGSSLVTITVDETYTEQGAVCDDDVDADKPATVGGDTVDTSTVGQYTVTYDCTDEAGNNAPQVSRIVNVEATPPTFVSSGLDLSTRGLTIIFSETIDVTPAANVDATKIHIRELDNYTGGGITLTASELVTTTDASTISFTLTMPHLETVKKLTTPELTIEPGAVQGIFENLIVGTFDVSTATFVHSFNVSSQDTSPRGMAFSNNGLKMFVVGWIGEDINEYTLDTPFDVSTASFDDVVFPVSDQEKTPTGMAFSNDGLKMFVVGTLGDAINEYTLITPFDLSTASYAGNGERFSVSSWEGSPKDVAFSNDGAKMFVVGAINGINEYTLDTPFDVSTASFVHSFSVSSREGSPKDVAFSNDGTKMFVVGAINGINEYTLNTPFNISVVTHVDSFSVSSRESSPTGVAFSNDGAKMFVVGRDNDAVNEYTLSSVYPMTVRDVNVAPVLNTIGDQTVNEFVELTFTATASDDDALTFSFDGTVPSGAAITSAGVFTWTPTESQVGSHDITVQVTDGSLTDSETLTVTVRDVNVAPVLNAIGDQTVNELVELTFTATASDDDSLTFSFDGTVPSGAAITDDGNFTWTPTESQDGDHTITVQVTDGSLTDSETLTVTVNEVNVAPVLNAIGDKGTSELVELTFTATASDTDVVDNVVNTLIFSLDGTVPSGAAITDDGNFTWTPTESQVGSHDITVQVTDGSLTDSETLTVTVNEVNVAPVLNAIGDQTVNELVELTFTATASDDDSLTFSFDGTVPPGAAITDDGNFTWTPTESQDGDHTITVQVTDGSLTDSETLTVTVNEVNVAPVLNAIGDKGTSELVELTFTAIASDTDVVDNVVNTLTFSFDGTFPSGAAITDDGNFTWTPTELQVGSHDITVQVTDGSLTDSETLTVTVRDVNVAPVLNTIDDQTVNELVELTFTATASDDDSLTFSFDGTVPSGAAITDDGNFTWTPTESQDGDHTITVQVTDGSLTDSETLTVTVNEVNVAPVLNAIGDKGTSELVELTFTATASDTDVVDNVVNTLTFSFDGTVPSGAAITDDGNFTWTPTELQVGSHDITVQVTDGSLTDSETLTVTVRDVNVAPVLNTIDDQTVNEFVELTFTATASDNDSLIFSLDGTVPSGAAITDDGNFTWTPTESQDGDHTITVQVTDGSLTDSETLTVTVNEVNVAPVLNAIGDKGTSELVELTFTATASDTDVVDNLVNTLTFSFDGTVPSGAAITDDGNFTWTPTELQVGSHDITVQVTDGSLTDSETLTVTVRDVNVAPVLNTIDDQTVNEFVELTFTATASDDDSLTFSFDGTVPSGAAITDDGNFTWTPTESQDGDHTITVQVTDGSLTDSETLTVTVNEVNVAPVLNIIGDKGTSELVELTFTATASDTDVVDNLVNTLTFSFDGTVPLGATITSAGVFTWTPTELQVGSHDITVQVTDGSLTDSETLTVTVRDVNVAPVLNTIDDQTVNEFVELTFTATASDNDSLIFSLDGTVPSGAAITDDGNFTWTPTESQDGDHTITVQVTDGSLTDSETLTVTVNEVNVAPVLNAIGDKGTSKLVELTFTATASDTDVVDNLVNTLTFSFDGTVPLGATITSAGVFTWTPTELQVGSHDITVQVTDGSLTDSETLTVTVRDVNVAPVLNTIDDQTVNEFVELTFTATASDNDSLIFSLDGTFPLGATITSAGVFTWTPTESQDGDHTITVQVTDGSLTDSETLTVTVNEVNVAPVLNAIGDKGTSKLVELTFTATASDTDVVDNLVNTLTFSFDGTVPPGATITSAGVFTWTPTELQVGSHDITVQVTDGSLTDSETLTVTVRDVNVAPVLNTIGDQTVNEFVELTFAATASDDDSLTFSFDGTFPSGAAITSAGVFTWTPTESQDGDHTITVQVTDGSLTDSETLTVTVNEVNVAPVLNAIGDKGTSKLVELTFTATASDTDVVDNLVNTLTFSLDGTFPLGATITSAGVFTWTPTELQVGSHDITVQVTDGSLTDSETLTVTVKDTTAPRRITLSADAFITTWRTDSANQTITIPVGGSTAKYSIDWGDNSPAETDITGDSTHTYREADSYTVSISGGLERFHLDGQQPNAGRLASIEQWGDTRWTTMDAAFDGATNMVYRATDTPDLSGVTDMHRMFGDATAFNGDLSSWDVSKVTDMSNMFIFAYDFNGNLSSWNVSSVTNMNEMFAVATSFNQPLNSWNVSRVTNMDDMFYFATAFSQNLGNWYVVANATSIARADVPGVVAEISAQNDHLNGHNPTYGISRDNDYAFFEIVNGNKINMTSVGTKSSYMVNVTASGSNVFEDGNNWRMLVVRVTGDNNADLGGLTISSGTLSPQFSSSDITYTASVDNSVTQVTVTPTASDSSATITVNGNTVISGIGYIVTGLTVGEPNTVTVIVTAQDSTTKTYTITLTRAASLSGNADLDGLTISSGTLSPQFSSSDITYTASVDNSVTQVTVTPTASDSSATITVNGNTVTSGIGYIVTGLTVGEPNTVTVIVTAQDSTTKTYTITLTRAASLSGNADLGGLTISSGTLSPQFSSSDITYTASVDNSVTQVTVTPTASDSLATITVNDNTVISGTGHILTGLIAGEPNTVTVIVTAQDSTTKTYIITLTRAASLSGNADLGSLTISSGTLSPQFSSSDITYTASVDNSVTQVTVTPTVSDSSATITVNDNTVISGIGYIVTGLIAGEPNTVTVIVTAQDSTTKTYIITLTRAASLSGNADLDGLTISSGTLSPQFSSSDITYTASVDNSVTQVTVTPTASDSSATITVNGNTVTSGIGYILTGLTVGEPNTVTVIVTAQDSTTKTYIITLTRAASLSGNADLGGLTISSGTLSPQFSSSDITYTASVDNSVTQVTVTPTASDSSATITVNGNTVTSGIGYIVTGLTVGEPNTVTVIVTAQDSTTKTYTITLTRAASLSGNADLDGLTISSGTLSPQFSSSDITYTASVDNSVTQVTVTPTASDSLATITVNDNTVISGIGYIVTGLIAGEPNTVTVIVTAQDSTTKTYIITLTRAASLSGNADLGGLTISSGTLSPQFSSSDITYTASVDNSVTQVTVTPTVSDSLATITVNDNTVTSGTGHILTGLIAGEPNTVTVIVTAQDSTTKTYTITLTRAASLSGNADLGGLTISSGTLSPQFSSSDITYTASVDNSVTQVTVTPTASDSSATITVNDNTVISGIGYIVTGLIAGEPNTVTVIVTAQDSTTKTYTITLTRAASLSGNADLDGLTISSGTLSPQFSSSDITYTASVDNSVTQVTVTPTASDSSATITVNDNTVISGIGYIVTGLTAGEPNTVTVIVTAQDSTTKTYIITVTVRDVPITVSSAAYNPGNGQLTITFNQDIATVDYSGLHVRSSANPDTGGITLSSVTGADYSGRTITATLDSEQQDQYDALQSPHLVVEDGAVTDTDGDRTTDVPPQPIRDASQKGSSSSSKASIVHINALAQSRIVDIPPHIAEQVESHDASDPLEPITPDDTFDLPLVINGYGYLLDAYENTLIPQTVTAGDNPVHITFTVYTEKEFAHFILYLNLQGRNTNYADSDTYITYKDDGTTSITDPHGYIGSATVTVTQEDDQIPEKRTVRITIEFGEEPMGPTNMVAYMWNTDREALFVKIIDALEVVAASPESAMQAADPEPLEPDSVFPADPEPVTPDFADDAADPEPVPYDILGPDDYDDTQILQIIRMWSGFESESITDEQLLELLGLDDHQGADIPDWMMTELGVLVAKGTVTVDEFMLALQYVLEHV